MSLPKIRIAEELDFSPKVIDFLSSFSTVELKNCDVAEIPGILEQTDVFWFRLAFKINASHFSPNTRVKILATPVTGIDHIDEAACRKQGIEIVSLRGETEFLKKVKATAEHTIALTLALLRKIPQALDDVHEGFWRRDLFRGQELYGKKVGLIGLGRLGSLVADYFKTFGCEVLAYDPRPDFDHSLAKRIDSLNALAAESDIISLHVNYTNDNRHLIGSEFFNACKPQAVFINTARGGLVDESALLDTLQKGRISGAAIDVIQEEWQVRADHPLIQYARGNDNLLITPHIGGNTHESFEKTEWFLAQKIKQALTKS